VVITLGTQRRKIGWVFGGLTSEGLQNPYNYYLSIISIDMWQKLMTRAAAGHLYTGRRGLAQGPSPVVHRTAAWKWLNCMSIDHQGMRQTRSSRYEANQLMTTPFIPYDFFNL